VKDDISTSCKSFGERLLALALVAFPMLLNPLLSFVFLIIVANYSEVRVYGDLVFAITLSTIVISFSDFGLRDFLLGKKAVDDNISIGANLFYPSVVGFGLIAGSVLIYLTISASGQLYIIWMSLLPEALALGVFHKSLFFSYQKDSLLASFSRADVLCKILPFFVKLTMYFATGNVWFSILTGSLLSLTIYLCWMYFRCAKSQVFFVGEPPASVLFRMASRWRQWIPYTLSFFAFFLYFSSDKIIIKEVLGEEQLAFYAAAYSFISVGQIIVTAVWSIYMPRISRGVDDFGQRRFVFISLLGGWLLFGFYAVFASFFFHYFYPSAYESSGVVLLVLSAFFIFRLPNVVYEMYWVAKDAYSIFFSLRLFSGVLNVVLNVLFVSVYGILAAAVTTVLSELLIFVLVIILEKRKLV